MLLGAYLENRVYFVTAAMILVVVAILFITVQPFQL